MSSRYATVRVEVETAFGKTEVDLGIYYTPITIGTDPSLLPFQIPSMSDIRRALRKNPRVHFSTL